jgi:AcrR family transcriptional regulator
MNAVPPPTETGLVRPRVEGDRELEVLVATLDVLADFGYDRLTMDAVATAAKASKATLYRRWNNKVSLVIDALLLTKGTPEVPDTGSLRGDLLAAYCGFGGNEGLMDPKAVARFSSVITALHRDAEFAAAFREQVIGPKIAVSEAIYANAKARGEVREDLDVSLFGPSLAGICLHRVYMLGETPDQDLIARIIDQIIVPAAMNPSYVKESNG